MPGYYSVHLIFVLRWMGLCNVLRLVVTARLSHEAGVIVDVAAAVVLVEASEHHVIPQLLCRLCWLLRL